jgi:hypothetical protein
VLPEGCLFHWLQPGINRTVEHRKRNRHGPYRVPVRTATRLPEILECRRSVATIDSMFTGVAKFNQDIYWDTASAPPGAV